MNREAALDLLQAFRAGDPAVSERHLWVLIVFSLWHQIYVERAYDPIALGWEKAQGGKALPGRGYLTGSGRAAAGVPGRRGRRVASRS